MKSTGTRGALTASLVVAFASAAPPARAANEGLPWTLSVEHARRSCQLMLRFDTAGGAGELGMPTGCLRAVPAIRTAKTWSIADGGQIRFSDASAQSVLTFERQPDGGWRATDSAGRGLVLTPSVQTGVEAASLDAAGAPPSDDAMALAANVVAPAAADGSVVRLAANDTPRVAVNAKELSGRYAVMRGDRDTGCMVTLESDARGLKGLRARLAPACRDQGITIFDPLGWQAKGSELVLTARKGHSISLDKDENGIWVKMPKDPKGLGLKRL